MPLHRSTAILVLSVAVALSAGLSCSRQTSTAESQKAPAAGSKPGDANSGTKAAATAPSSASDEQVVITLERTMCFGECPYYTVTIHGDGSVVYVGKEFVRVTGEQHGTVQHADVARLVDMFERAHFFDLKDRYSAEITDLPTYRVTYERNGRSKTVEDYWGRDVGMPQAVTDLEQEIDRVAQTEKWVRTPKETPAPAQK